jgi:hypothetical protein
MSSSRFRGKRDVIHPIFITCKEECTNEYWKGVFDDLAYGKYPKQIYVSSGMIQSSSKKKLSFCYVFKNKKPHQIIKDVVELLTNYTDLISSDEIKQKKNVNEQYKKDVWHQWKDIKRKYIKDVLLMEYCLDLRKTYNWTLRKATQVYQALSLRVYGSQLTDIKLMDGRIESVTGMQLTPSGEVVFDDTNEFRSEQIYAMEDYVYNYCKRYISRNVRQQTEN